MKRIVLMMIIVVSIAMCLLSGCSNTVAESAFQDIDYIDWYRDINDTGTYNLTSFIDLDIWFSSRIADYDWSDTKFDVYCNETIICSDLNVEVHENYLTCYCSYTDEGVGLIYNDFLAPGTYRITIKDSGGDEILSSSCVVTAESGEALSQMITSIEMLNEQNDSVLVRINFNSDITPYTKTGFYIMASKGGEPLELADNQCFLELADTYMIIVFKLPDDEVGGIQLSIYSGDEVLICELSI